ncbi:AtpZ/AtpI family protein [Microlunatus flavus]|nr:AtpZ/AtpI family protein [Microlunatus flavus]
MTQQGQQPQPGTGGSGPDKTAMDQGMRALSYLISGVLLYGALGWVGDHFLHTRFLLPIGIVLGAAFGIYSTIRRLSVTDLDSKAGTSVTTKEGGR